jgi:hypothetical protein
MTKWEGQRRTWRALITTVLTACIIGSVSSAASASTDIRQAERAAVATLQKATEHGKYRLLVQPIDAPPPAGGKLVGDFGFDSKGRIGPLDALTPLLDLNVRIWKIPLGLSVLLTPVCVLVNGLLTALVSPGLVNALTTALLQLPVNIRVECTALGI